MDDKELDEKTRETVQTGSCMVNGYTGLCETCPDKDNPDLVCNQDE